jgi:hypothetical protein
VKLVRLYTGTDGLSHFEDVEVAVVDRTGRGESISEWMEARGVAFRTNRPGYSIDWHTAPRRQLVANLQGEMEIEASNGETRRFGPGTVMLVEDTGGKGHRTRVTSSEERLSVSVALDGDLDALPFADEGHGR